ncbi:NTF2-like protein [Artomyces pyxidatus]|uniref:NTF2-like protein n=1 Tax=Artomyces pyxidatus TaxID=48021 RepID=A0ACB8TFF3_9AGAM|nr:NTF2-like protein [Artomyces pyxidatus]
MFQTPPPASGSRTLATNALRKAGLMDRDERMRDASDKPGGRKGSSKFRSHQPRLATALGKQQPASLGRKTTLATRIAGPSSEPLSIRGAARPTAAGRVRRNAISINGGKALPGVRPPIGNQLEVWRQFVQKRWDPESRFLNLERMSEDDIVKRSHVIPPGMAGSTGKEAAVIFKLAAQLKPPVRTVSLANNGLHSTHPIASIAHYLPNLANLSLENNNLRVWKDIDSLSQLTDKKDKLGKLRELILLGNPIRDLEYQNNRSDSYKNNIMRRFPTLDMLDKEPVTKISFDAPEASQATEPPIGPRPAAKVFPAEMRPSFVFGFDPAITTAFLGRFFQLFDTQRAALIDAYHESATFSFQANTSIPVRARIQGFQHSLPNQRNLEWSKWLGAGSRNLSRVAGAVDKMLKSMHVGREDAVKTMMSLPSTKHDIVGSPEKFLIDAWPITQGEKTTLFVSIHGQFTEEPAGGIRSFDRSFVLAPAMEGSRAKAGGWDVEVLSDQLVIRAYSSHEAWTPGPLLVQAPLPAAAPGPPASVNIVQQMPPDMQALLATIPEPQRSQVVEVCQRTRLNVQFAVDCLQGNSWVVDAAIANFEQVKTTLGRDAFL